MHSEPTIKMYPQLTINTLERRHNFDFGDVFASFLSLNLISNLNEPISGHFRSKLTHFSSLYLLPFYTLVFWVFFQGVIEREHWPAMSE